MEHIRLNNGIETPVLGFGVFQIPPQQTEKAVLEAIEVGYRLIDTAQAYRNEKEVGNAIKNSGVERKELFVTSKVWISNFGYEKTKTSVLQSLEALQTDYADLFLLHQPLGDIYGAWRALEELYNDGKIKSIGMSNFYPERLAEFVSFNNIIPAVNQVEINPFFQQGKALEYMRREGVQPQAWAPFAEGKNDIFTNPSLIEISKKYGKSVGQVILRWNVQRGVVVLAKSVRKERMTENINIFDFELSVDDMAKISMIDSGKSTIIDHYDPEVVKFLINYKD